MAIPYPSPSKKTDMSILKKLKKTKRTRPTVGDHADLIINFDQLKKRRLLHTTDHGVFYTYERLIQSSPHPKVFCKNLYIYARATKLLPENQPLKLYDLDSKALFAEVTSKSVTFH